MKPCHGTKKCLLVTNTQTLHNADIRSLILTGGTDSYGTKLYTFQENFSTIRFVIDALPLPLMPTLSRRDGGLVNYNNVEVGQDALLFKKVSQDIAGVYEISAANVAGIITKTFNLTVESKYTVLDTLLISLLRYVQTFVM